MGVPSPSDRPGPGGGPSFDRRVVLAPPQPWLGCSTDVTAQAPASRAPAPRRKGSRLLVVAATSVAMTAFAGIVTVNVLSGAPMLNHEIEAHHPVADPQFARAAG